MLEQTFALVYGSKGAFSWGDVNDMSPKDRYWFIERLFKQKEDEHEQIKKAQSKHRTRRR